MPADSAPADLDALLARGEACAAEGDLAGAEAVWRVAVTAWPDAGRPAYHLGRLLLDAGRPAEAFPLLETAARVEQSQREHWGAYAEALVAVGRPADAQRLIARLRELRLPEDMLAPIDARAFVRIAEGLVQQGRFDEAESLLRRAEALAPNDADPPAARAASLTRQGRHTDAEAAYGAALALAPERASLWSNLGATQALLGREAEAEGSLRRALAIDPDEAAARRNLATILRSHGRLEAARETVAESDAADLVIPTRLALSPIAASREAIAADRAAYAEGLAALSAWPRTLRYTGEPFGLPSFYLAYQGLADRPLMEATAAAWRAALPALAYESPKALEPPARERIRVMFVSDNLNNHTIGHLYRGIIEQLDRGRFEVFVAHGAHSRVDAFREGLDAACDQAITLNPALELQRAQIEHFAPDVLFFPDLGMSAPSYALAHARLAPVQAAGWGHPDTTGLATIDYFVSCDGFEPAGAEAHYTERLVRLARNPCCFVAPLKRRAGKRADFGLPERGRLYGCPQTLFKLHPDFDAVLAAIAAADPEGWIVVPEADQPAWTRAIKARWAERAAVLAERAHWTPRIAPEAFLAQLDCFDVLLDPLHFGSGYTFYQAMARGTPMVTWPGEFARGRVVAGLYRQMGAGEELVAENPADYAARAVALARDPDRRAALSASLQQAAEAQLFNDRAAVRGLGDFFAAATEAARRGETLPSGWPANP